MDRPANLMVVNTVLWFDVPVDQGSVLQLFQERVVWRFRRWLRAGGLREPVAAAGAG